MIMTERYESAKKIYASIGIDTDAVIEKLDSVRVSLHCWQGDDVSGFESSGELSGGIQATGNYPGKARNAKELMADLGIRLEMVRAGLIDPREDNYLKIVVDGHALALDPRLLDKRSMQDPGQ
ncbi:MAG: L-rhamnose isomerase, partial [Acutalibacteraceae bacterium]|nr:L-rhamnose isomerase [Acutalibacteraceae bacterium]